jgi:hypothetical protein
MFDDALAKAARNGRSVVLFGTMRMQVFWLPLLRDLPSYTMQSPISLSYGVVFKGVYKASMTLDAAVFRPSQWFILFLINNEV